MLSTHQITSSINVHTFTFAAGKLAYRTGCGIANDVRTIRNAAPFVLYGIATAVVLVAMLVIAVIRYILPALPVIAKALALVAIPALAMFAVLTVPGLPLCLAAFALFAVATGATL